MSKYISRWRTCPSHPLFDHRPLFPLEIDHGSLRLGGSNNNGPCSLQSQASGVIVFKTGTFVLSNNTVGVGRNYEIPKTVEFTLKGWEKYEDFTFKVAKIISTTKIKGNNAGNPITKRISSTETGDGVYNPWFEIKVTFQKEQYKFIIPYPVFGSFNPETGPGFINGSTLTMFIQEQGGQHGVLDYAYQAFITVDNGGYRTPFLSCKVI